jgi:hypothetical protein
MAYTITSYTGENIWQWSYETLLTRHHTIANHIDPASWPSQNEPDLEMEDGDLLPDFSGDSYLILKYRNDSYVFEGGAPTTWAELNSHGIYGISSHVASVPEPSIVILLGSSLLLFAAIRKRIKKI